MGSVAHRQKRGQEQEQGATQPEARLDREHQREVTRDQRRRGGTGQNQVVGGMRFHGRLLGLARPTGEEPHARAALSSSVGEEGDARGSEVVAPLVRFTPRRNRPKLRAAVHDLHGAAS